MLKVLIGADIVPTKSNCTLFKDGNAEKLVGVDLLCLFNESDYRILNLETPLADTDKTIVKCGPHLIAQPSTVNGIKALGVDLVTLANNHIMDYGSEGFESTVRVLKENGINSVGAGMNITQARKPFVFTKNEITIGVYACAEHEFSIATDSEAGANPYEPLDSFDHVRSLKDISDFVIVLYHGGKEHYRYPSPYLQRIFRKFADYGADYVIAQHTHCVGCKENYNDSVLIYGQGNFLFDMNDNEYWNSALLLQITFDKDRKKSIKYVPIQKNEHCIRLANNQREILDGFEHRSTQITKEDFITKEYSKFARNESIVYLKRISGGISKNLIFKIINKLTGNRLIELIYGKNTLPEIQNCIECEAHRELFNTYLKNRLKE